jgi:hypothetical protein
MKQTLICCHHLPWSQPGKQPDPQGHQPAADERITIGMNLDDAVLQLQMKPDPVLTSLQQLDISLPFLSQRNQNIPLPD